MEGRLNNNEDDLQEEDADPETQWQQLKTILHETTAEVAGYATRKNRDWFDEKTPRSKTFSKRNAPVLRVSLPSQMNRQPKPLIRSAYRNACSSA